MMWEKRCPPRTKQPPPPPGEDFDSMSAAHGRPQGRFEKLPPPKRPQIPADMKKQDEPA